MRTNLIHITAIKAFGTTFYRPVSMAAYLLSGFLGVDITQRQTLPLHAYP